MPVCGHVTCEHIQRAQVVEAVEVRHLFNAWDVLVECARDDGHALAVHWLGELGSKRPEEVCRWWRCFGPYGLCFSVFLTHSSGGPCCTPLAMSACSRRRRKSLDGLLELPKLCVPKLK